MGGGDTVKDVIVENKSSSYTEFFSRSSSPNSCCVSDDLGFKDGVSEENFPNFSNHVADLRRREKAYQEILESHDLLLRSSKRTLKLARDKILSYTPGSWSDMKLSDYDIPKTTSIILVGPKGAGKSSLVNRIARVIEDDEFAPERAQESYGMQSKGGTFFVQEYMIPRRDSASFCLYDTRGLSHVSSSCNVSMIKQWITRGVHHGEPVICSSDSSEFKDRLIRDGSTGYEIKKVNFVIFVVNAVEFLKSIEGEMSYAQMISTAFDCPLLSFKDDKPAVVMTHGDLLSREERARVRVRLGEFLGIPPEKQIFDIPESRDTATAITVCNLLRYSLEHGDKNLVFQPKRFFTISKFQVRRGFKKENNLLRLMLFALVLLLNVASIWFGTRAIASRQNVAHEAQHKQLTVPSPRLNNLMHEAQQKRCIGPQRVIRGRNLACVPNPEPESVPKGEPSIDWHTTRRLWFDEGKVAEAEPSFDWRTTRRLWYVE